MGPSEPPSPTDEGAGLLRRKPPSSIGAGDVWHGTAVAYSVADAEGTNVASGIVNALLDFLEETEQGTMLPPNSTPPGPCCQGPASSRWAQCCKASHWGN